ncbi:MAG: NUDIX domain-containing protein [Defluviitaleaceae bacterium]|nr:NUDIX domain-containing protein [Defluviitaleaceae bacterium]
MNELWDILDENGNKTGRLHKRGKPMADGDFHLVVHVWIVNSKGEFLISKRTANKNFPLMWECTGGSAVAGDDSLTTALKEVREELGIELKHENGEMFTSLKRYCGGCGGYDFVDVWVFRQDISVDDIIFQPDETCDAMWASKHKIIKMIDEGSFMDNQFYTYIDKLFAYIGGQ